MEINHFSHEHPLVLSEEKFNKHFLCGACCEPIFGVSYCCLVCSYVLHKYCADVPRELALYKYHPDHPLVLRPSPKTLSRCKSCNKEISGFAYSCNDECSFDIHVYCALFPDYDILLDLLGQNIKLYLIPAGTTRQCSICLNCIDKCASFTPSDPGSLYNIFYHIQCAMLPQVVKHDRHRHEFTLHPPLKEKEKYNELFCDLCEEERNPDDHIYYCELCELVGHIGCGVSGIDRPLQGVLSNFPEYKLEPEEVPQLMPQKEPAYQFGSYKDGETIEDGGDLKFVQTVNCLMKHPMVVTNFKRTIEETCARCSSFIYGITYSCKECNFHIHKRCTELPREIHHSRFRLLKLLVPELYKCLTCGRKSPFWFYCSEESAVDGNGYCIYCAVLPDNLNHPSHEHVLTPVIVFPSKSEDSEDDEWSEPANQSFSSPKIELSVKISPLCQACGLLCQHVTLACEECNFYLHVFCSLLPLTGKHMRHGHELSLTYSYKEDPVALEFFCDTCEKPRIPNRWVYYCPDPKCVIVSHIECMDADIFNTYDIQSELPADFLSLGLE